MSKSRKNHVDKINGYEFIKVFLDFMCAWCAAPLDEDGPVYAVTISQPHFDWNEHEGKYVPLPTFVCDKPTVPAFVPTRDSELSREGVSLCLAFCSHECREKFQMIFEHQLETIEESFGSICKSFLIKEGKA